MICPQAQPASNTTAHPGILAIYITATRSLSYHCSSSYSFPLPILPAPNSLKPPLAEDENIRVIETDIWRCRLKQNLVISFSYTIQKEKK